MNDRLDNWNGDMEKSIRLEDMIFYVLRKWRVMLIVALIGAVAAAAFTFVKSAGQSQTPVSSVISEAEWEVLEEKLLILEAYEDTLEYYNDYEEGSMMIRLDPNCFYEGSQSYLFTGPDFNSVFEVYIKCKEMITSVDTLERLSEELDGTISPEYLKEAIILERELPYDSVEAGQDDQQNARIVVKYDNSEDCEKILAFYEKEIEKVAEAFEGSSARITVTDPMVTLSTDRDLIALRRNVAEEKQKLIKAIDTLKSEFTDTEREHYQKLQQMEETGEAVSEEPAAVPSKGTVNWMLAALAAVAGIIVTAGVYVLLYFFSRRINTKEELESCTSIPVLALEEAREVRNPIDRVLNKAEKAAGLVSESTIGMIAATLAQYAQQTEGKRIYLTGSCGTEGFAEAELQQLKKELLAGGVELMYGNSIVKDAKALQDAIACGAVVFAEKKGSVKTRTIQEELFKAASCNLEVLAVILKK